MSTEYIHTSLHSPIVKPYGHSPLHTCPICMDVLARNMCAHVEYQRADNIIGR